MPPKMSPEIAKCHLRRNIEKPCFNDWMRGQKEKRKLKREAQGTNKQGLLAAPS